MVNFFFLLTPKIWVDRTSLNGEKKEGGLTDESIQGSRQKTPLFLPLPPPLPSPVRIVDAPAGESVFKRPGTSRHILD